MTKKSDGPIFYNPKKLSQIAQRLGAGSYIVLLVYGLAFALYMGVIFKTNNDMFSGYYTQYFSIIDLLGYVQPVKTLVAGFSVFLIMQGISIGLNVLLEIDFNMKSKAEGEENE